MQRKHTVAILSVIIILAAGLRIWGIRWGLPSSLHYFSYHPDETVNLLAAMRINFFEGQLDPDFYHYGSLFFYLVSIATLIGMGVGLINLPPDDPFSRISEFADLYMAGRIVALLLGVATVYLVYRIARLAYGRRAGLFAALLMAVVPIHVTHSKFLAVDVPATFFVAATLVFALRIVERQRFRDYLFAGLFAGFAAGTKYNAALVLLSPMVAHLIVNKARPSLRLISPKLWTIPIAAAAGFIIATPGVLLNTPKFVHDFTSELRHARTGHGFVFMDTPIGLVYHVSHSLWAGMGVPLLALSAVGVLYALIRRRPSDVVLLAFLIPYYLVIGVSQVKFARYTIPMLPVLVVLAAGVSADATRRLLAGPAFSRCVLAPIAGLLLVLITVHTAAYSVVLNSTYGRRDTRDACALWVREHVPPGSSIGLPTLPWFYTPPLDPFFGFVNPSDRWKQVEEFSDYPLVVSRESEWNAQFLESEKPDYVILSEFEYEDRIRVKDPAVREYFDVLERDYKLECRFARAQPLYPRYFFARHLPHDMSYASPTTLVYSRKME